MTKAARVRPCLALALGLAALVNARFAWADPPASEVASEVASAELGPPSAATSAAERVYLRTLALRLREAIGAEDVPQVSALALQMLARGGLSPRALPRLGLFLVARERYAVAWALVQSCARSTEPATRTQCRSVAARARPHIAWLFPAHEGTPEQTPSGAAWTVPVASLRVGPGNLLVEVPYEDAAALGGFYVVRAGRVTVRVEMNDGRSSRVLEVGAGDSVRLRVRAGF